MLAQKPFWMRYTTTAMSEQTLCTQRVLVTRPAHQASNLINLLRSQGATPVALPLLEIQPVTEQDPAYHPLKSQIMDLDLFHKVIFISPNAARLGCEWIDLYWPQLPIAIDWLAVGKQSAQQLSNFGIDAYHNPLGYDSEALLQAPMLQDVQDQKILIMRGQGGRETLAETLKARGAEVSYAELYQRCCPTYNSETISQAFTPQPDSILISSGAGIDNLMQLSQQHTAELSTDSLLSCHLVVPSERVRKLAETAGFKRITLAPGPDDEAMLQALMP